MADRDGLQLAPGVYDLGDGSLHVDEEQFIRGAGGNPDSARDRKVARRVIARVCAEHGIPYEERHG
jgi:hypothetical protein